MNRKLLAFLICLVGMGLSLRGLAQERTVSGKVTDATDGSPLPGVSVIVKGTTMGVITDSDGVFKLSISGSEDVLIFSFVGMKTQEEKIGSRSVIDVQLETDVTQLSEVVVTGVAGDTQKEKLTFSVGKIGRDLVEEVPGANAGLSLQGKIAGVTVIQGSGLPGTAPNIRIRGATSLTGSQDPLVLLDGVILEGSLADINSQDIESIEVLKGATASSLYGSRAANGVIQIITKKGIEGKGKPVITYRSEYGQSSLKRKFPLSKSHPYQLTVDGTDFLRDANDNLILEADKIADNPYPQYYDQTKYFYGSNPFHSEYTSIAAANEKANIFLSFENTGQEGILKFKKFGYDRQNLRVNVEYKITERLKISANNLYSRSTGIEPQVGVGTPFYSLLFMPAHIDLSAPNEENGEPYNWDAPQDGWSSSETNPLYDLYKFNFTQNRSRIISNVDFKYNLMDWVYVEGYYSTDNLFIQGNTFVDKDYLNTQNQTFLNGYIQKDNQKIRGDNYSATLGFDKDINENLNIKSKLNYFSESQTNQSVSAGGLQIGVKGINDLNNVVAGQEFVSSSKTQIIARSFSGIVALDYSGKYLIDALLRQDEVSLFGPQNRSKTFYRVSGAYRIGEDLQMPQIQELKVRASYGTSGLRPPFTAQYETFALSNGTIGSPQQIGNKNLGPYYSREFEAGLNVHFLQRFDFEFTYSKTSNEGQVIPVPLSAAAGGPPIQWQNAGTLGSRVIEGTLGVDLVTKTDISWNVNFLFSKVRQSIEKLNRPELQVGPQNAFIVKEGEVFGAFYGRLWLTSLDQLPVSADKNDYEVNDDGYVILKSSGMPQLLKNESGTPRIVKIGDINPRFNMSFNSTFKFKGLSLYILVDWKKGGDVYNLTKQWTLRELNHAEVDQAGKSELDKKSVDYYSTLYDTNSTNSHFVEDGSYIKLREVNLSYNIPLNWMRSQFIKQIKVGIVGRNLGMITKYSGIDPEVTSTGTHNDPSNYMFDGFGYPNFTTFTGSIQFKF